MKKMIRLFYRLFDKDFEKRLALAQSTYRNITQSTRGHINHFYNMQGDKIRGWEGKTYHSVSRHPLVEYYNKN